MNINTTLYLLTSLHNALSGLNGFLNIAPKTAIYPLMTYNLITSKPTRVKSFTTDGTIYTVQFSYFDDTTVLNCFTLAQSAETVLDSLSGYFDFSNGRTSIVGNTEQSKLFQVIDIRDIEIVQED
jgi:hypothetical protein